MFGELVSAFTLGLSQMSNPCVLPLYPGFLAYLASNQDAMAQRRTARFLGIVTLAGVLTSMLAIGFILALTRTALNRVQVWLLPLIYVFVIVMGVLMLFDKNPFVGVPMLRSPRLKNPLLTSFVYGLLYGPMTLPCSGPMLVSAFALSTDAAFVAESILFVFFFALGFGLPLVILPFLGDLVRGRLLRFMATHHHLLTRISGLILIGIGIFQFWTHWDDLSLMLGSGR